MRIIKLVSLITALLATITMFTGCGKEKPHDWETPLGYKERIEQGLELYINDHYHYAIDYPGIFNTLEKTDEGMTASSEEATLDVWVEQSEMTAEEMLNEISAENEVTKSYVSDTSMQAVFTVGEDEVYRYTMLNEDYRYSFEFMYPVKRSEEFQSQCDAMINRFVIITPMSEADNDKDIQGDESEAIDTAPVIPEGENIYDEISSEIDALNLVRDNFAKEFTVKTDGEMSYMSPDKPDEKLVLEGSAGDSYLVRHLQSIKDENGNAVNKTINWYRIVKKNGYSVMEPMME